MSLGPFASIRLGRRVLVMGGRTVQGHYHPSYHPFQSVLRTIRPHDTRGPNLHSSHHQSQTLYFSSSSWNWSNKSTQPSTPSPSSSDSTDTTTTTKQQTNPKVNEILDSCNQLHTSIMSLNTKVNGPLARNSNQSTSLPFVFLVGNHSSGKSSFINYICGRDVQTAGVAPTDDCFTVIAPGSQDMDQDGPALIGDPDRGFSALRSFGPTLIHHTQLKIRSNIDTQDFMLIDSPGTIDSPLRHNSNQYHHPENQFSSSNGGGSSYTGYYGNGTSMDRGYDFQGVVRWFAQRADIVLLFFDPDKPGTTGETLSILLHSLGGMDHKLNIILNKADQFKKIHDFARAYGSLCWNLSKVIPRKDLPQIYTMCLPTKSNVTDSITTNPTSSTTQEHNGISSGLQDLHQTRDVVVEQVKLAPKRRIDNAITDLNDSVQLLLMHCKVSRNVQGRYKQMVWNYRTQELGTLCGGLGISALTYNVDLIPIEVTMSTVALTMVGLGGLNVWNRGKISEMEKHLLSMEELGKSFQRMYSRDVTIDADEYIVSLWQRIRDNVKMALMGGGTLVLGDGDGGGDGERRSNGNIESIGSYPSITDGEIHDLEKILEDEIPKLRRLASSPSPPSHVSGGR